MSKLILQAARAAQRAAFINLEDGYEAFAFHCGGPLDAPEVMPAGSVVAREQFGLLAGSALRIGAADKLELAQVAR